MLKKLLVLVLTVTAVASAADVTAVTPKINTEAVPFYGTVPNAEYPATDPVQWRGGMTYPQEMMMPAAAKQAGVTTYDHQQNGAQGNRVVPFPFDNDTCVHVCWTYSADEDETHAGRAVYWNVWSNNASKWLNTTGSKANGANRAGYTTMGVLPDGKAVIAFHELLTSSLSSAPVSKIAVEAAPGFRVLNSPVQVSQNQFNGDYPIWPHIVVGSNNVIHAVSCNQDTAHKAVCYSRSTDQGASYSEWVQISDYEGADVGVAVSDDGMKVAITWVKGVSDDFSLGHVLYKESTDGGLTWGTEVDITDGYYPDDFPMEDNMWRLWANFASNSIAYDKQGNIHIVFEESLWMHGTDGSYYIMYPYHKRIRYWNEVINDFTTPSGKFGTYIPWYVDEVSGDTILDTSIYDMALWGTNADLVNTASGTQFAAWKPQLSFWGNNPVVVFAGQRSAVDLSVAGIPNGDIYVTVSDNNGQTWKPLNDWDYTVVPHRAWWSAHMGCVTNVTSTYTPDATPGNCMDEQFFTVWPRTTRSNILHLTYQLDLFSGPALPDYGAEGYYTSNPIMYMPVQMKVGTVTGTFNPDDGTDYPRWGIEDGPSIIVPSLELVGSGISKGSVSFSVTSPATNGSLKVYDASGALVKTIYEGSFNGKQTFTWNGTDSYGNTASQGVYFYSFVTSEITKTGRVVLIH